LATLSGEVGDRGDGGTDETPAERLARNWGELLQEIRVTQAGVQIMFAFLLTLPFTQRWGEVTAFQRGVYLVTLLLTAFASMLLIGPVAYHRTVFRLGAKPILVEAANTMALAGLFTLALAINGGVLLIVDVLMCPLATVLIVSATAAAFVWLWGWMPILLRRRLERRGAGLGGGSTGTAAGTGDRS
jgi:hypothetical protein